MSDQPRLGVLLLLLASYRIDAVGVAWVMLIFWIPEFLCKAALKTLRGRLTSTGRTIAGAAATETETLITDEGA